MKLAISKLKNALNELKELGGYPRIKKRISDYEEAIECLTKNLK